MENLYWMAVATVVIVLFFDYTNGFHDAANIVATIIASRADPGAGGGLASSSSALVGGGGGQTIGKFAPVDVMRVCG